MVLKSLAIASLIRKIFFGIDKIFYNWISEIYNLLVTIARVSPLSQADIVDMSDRIYRLLAIFMIFKVTFSLIMYVVNPDDFSDKSKGWGKLTSNIIISLALLILTPYIFNMAYRLQAIILEDNSLAALIFGEDGDKGFFNTAGDQMAFIAMSPFMSPDISQFPACSILTQYENGELIFNEQCSGLSNEDLTGLSGKDIEDTLYYQTSNGASKNSGFELKTLQNYVEGVRNKNMGMAFREDIITATNSNKDEFIMDYSYFFSTAVAILIILLLISFCLDIATRSMKLAFFQLIAPIPIISFVDPKSGKDGMFKKWYKACFSTYLSLFIRLLSIYFAVYIISKLQNLLLYDAIDQTFITSKIAVLFIMIGALMFAKQLPKILENLGIKLDGGGKFTLNPLKKLDEEALGFKKGRQFAGRLGAAGAAGLLAGATNFGTRLKNEKGINKLKAIGSGIAGGASATRRGIQGAIKGEKMMKNFSNSYSGAMNAKKARDDRKALGVSWNEAASYRMQKKMGISTPDEEIKGKVKRVEEGKIKDSPELKNGFRDVLTEKYGESLGTSKYNKLSQDDHFYLSNKELADEKKSLQSKSKAVSEVSDGKGKDTLTAKAKGADPSKLRAYEEIKNRKLDFYTKDEAGLFNAVIDGADKKYKDALQKYNNATTTEEKNAASDEIYAAEEERNKYKTLLNKYKSSSSDEKLVILQDVAREQYEKDRKRIKGEYEADILDTLSSNLSDPNKKLEVEETITSMYNSILSTEDDALKASFQSALDPTGKNIFTGVDGIDIDFSKIGRDEIASLMDALDKNGNITYNAIKSLSDIRNDIDTIEEIETTRSTQTTKLQSDETARHIQDVASVANSGGKK